MNSAVYEDKPYYDVWMKSLMALPALFAVVGAGYMVGKDTKEAIALLAVAVIVAAVYWAIFPRKYSIHSTGMKIILGGPFSFNVPFERVESAIKPEGATIGINFPGSFSSAHAVQIVRIGKMSVNITPQNPEVFMEQFNRTLGNWRASGDRAR
ncbi:MAG: hypothetical protein FJ024_08095 [Chloroflexi bacterium]|nr:hypothetical protein [Chloroflexota bacterium]